MKSSAVLLLFVCLTGSRAAGSARSVPFPVGRWALSGRALLPPSGRIKLAEPAAFPRAPALAAGRLDRAVVPLAADLAARAQLRSAAFRSDFPPESDLAASAGMARVFDGIVLRLPSHETPVPSLGAQSPPSGGIRFTGLSSRPARVDSLLHAGRPSDALRLAEVFEAASRSRAGRKVLRAVLALAARIGWPVEMRVVALKGSMGEYDYIHRVLYVDRSFIDGDARHAAATLVHELVHVLQHAEGVVSEALEMEMEAHVITLRVMDELGTPPEPGSFSRAAAEKLRESPRAFTAWLAGQLPGRPCLENGGIREAVSMLEAEADDLEDEVARAENFARRHPSARVRLKRARERLACVYDDLDALRSREGRTAYRKLAARARSLMERYHRALIARQA